MATSFSGLSLSPLRPRSERPQAGAFDSVLMARLVCEHCGREFIVENDVP